MTSEVSSNHHINIVAHIYFL